MFPLRRLRRGGTYALFATESGKLEIVSINADRGRIFHCKFGSFQLNKKYRYQFGKSDIYFYDQKCVNPLDISALVNIKDYLAGKKEDDENEMKNAPILTEYEISLVTNKLQDYLRNSPFVVTNDQGEPTGLTVQAADMQNILLEKLDDNTRSFLDDYFEEDEIAQTNMLSRIQQEIKFRYPISRKAMELIPQRTTMGKRNLALIVINNRLLDLVPVDAMQDEETGLMMIADPTKRYGSFVVRETKTRYRYGKTNVFIVGVKTVRRIPKPVAQELMQQVITTDGKEQLFDPNKPMTSGEVIRILEHVMEEKNGKSKKKRDDKRKEDAKKRDKRGKKDKNEIDPLTGNPKEGELAVDFVPLIKTGRDGKPVGEHSETISINAMTFLPKVAYIDPLLAETRVKTTQHQKVVTDLLGGPIGKKIPISPILVLFLIMGTAIGSVIIWQQIIEPRLEADEQKRLNALIQQQQRQQQQSGTPPTQSGGDEIFDVIPNPFGGFIIPKALSAAPAA